MADDLEAKAREFFLEFDRWLDEDDAPKITRLTELLRSVAAESRKEALEDAIRTVKYYCTDGNEAGDIVRQIRALAERKEGT